MERAETFTLEMFIRTHGFVAARPTVFPATSRCGELNAQLGTVIATLRQHAATQSASTRSSREGTRLKSVRLDALQDDLEAINRTARAIALNRPGFDEKFRLPKNKGTQSWLAAARVIAEEAEPDKQDFIRLGLPANFLEDMRADIAEIGLCPTMPVCPFISNSAQQSIFGEGDETSLGTHIYRSQAVCNGWGQLRPHQK